MSTTNETTQVVVRLGDVYDAMRAAFRAALTTGRNWHAVTVGHDGTPYAREEVSRCVSPAEYYSEGRPHPVTVWSTNGDISVPEEEVEAEVDFFDPADLATDLTEKLEAAGFTVEA